MKDVKHSITITVATDKVIPIATEPKPKKIATLTNTKGESVQLKSHQIKRDLLKFLESSGISLETIDAPAGCMGKTELNKVPVKISPINHSNYDAGVFIKVEEEGDELDLRNTLKVLRYLSKKGIDIDKFCKTNEKGTSCLMRFKDELKKGGDK